MHGSKDDFKRNNAFILYDLYGHTLAQEPQHWGSWNLYNFGRPFLGHHHYTLSLSEPCPWVEKTLFTPKLPPFGEGDHEIYNFLSSCPTDATY